MTNFKTNIVDRQITNIDEAKKYLYELIKHHEIYHPDDVAEDIIWVNEALNVSDTYESDCKHLNTNMDKCIEMFDKAGEDIYEYIWDTQNNLPS